MLKIHQLRSGVYKTGECIFSSHKVIPIAAFQVPGESDKFDPINFQGYVFKFAVRNFAQKSLSISQQAITVKHIILLHVDF